MAAKGAKEEEKTPSASEACAGIPGPLMSGKEALEYQLKISSTWALLAMAAQLVLSTLFWYTDYFVYLLVHTCFVTMGMTGVQLKSKCLVFTHFAYTLFLSFIVLFVMGEALMNGESDIPFFYYAFAIAFVLIQTVGMRHERALILLFPLSEEVDDVEAGISKAYSSADASDDEAQPLFQTSKQQEQQQQQQQQQQPSSKQDIQMYAYDVQEDMAGMPVMNYEYVPTLPQYPMMIPTHYPGQQQPFVVLPYQPAVPDFPLQDQDYLPPMMYYHPTPNHINMMNNMNIGMPAHHHFSHGYPVMVPAPAQLYTNNNNNNNNDDEKSEK